MRKTFYEVYDSNGEQLTDRLLNTRDEALKLIDFYGLTDIFYEIKEYYCHESPDDPDRQRRSEMWDKKFKERKIMNQKIEEEYLKRKAEREKIKAKALKK
jgi:hypothetical protein